MADLRSVHENTSGLNTAISPQPRCGQLMKYPALLIQVHFHPQCTFSHYCSQPYNRDNACQMMTHGKPFPKGNIPGSNGT